MLGVHEYNENVLWGENWMGPQNQQHHQPNQPCNFNQAQGVGAPRNAPYQYMQPQAPPPQQSYLEEALATFMNFQTKFNEKVDENMTNLCKKVDQLITQTKMLETQVAQQAAASSSRAPGAFPIKPEINPIEECKAISVQGENQVIDPAQDLSQDQPSQTQGALDSSVSAPKSASSHWSASNIKVQSKLLGRSFLSTAGVLISCKNDRLSMNVKGELVEYNIVRAMKQSIQGYACYDVDRFAKMLSKNLGEYIAGDPLQFALENSESPSSWYKVKDLLVLLHSSPGVHPKSAPESLKSDAPAPEKCSAAEGAPAATDAPALEGFDHDYLLDFLTLDPGGKNDSTSFASPK